MNHPDSCRLRIASYTFRGTLRLAPDALVFAGDTQLTLPLLELRDVQPGDDGALIVTHSGGQFTLTFEHESATARWTRRLGRNRA